MCIGAPQAPELGATATTCCGGNVSRETPRSVTKWPPGASGGPTSSLCSSFAGLNANTIGLFQAVTGARPAAQFAGRLVNHNVPVPGHALSDVVYCAGYFRGWTDRALLQTIL